MRTGERQHPERRALSEARHRASSRAEKSLGHANEAYSGPHAEEARTFVRAVSKHGE
jgi:hypothetical protein